MWKLSPANLLLVIVSILVASGLVILYSTSGLPGVSDPNDPGFFLKRQLTWAGLGFVAFVITSKLNYHVYRRLAVPLTVISLVLLVLVFVPGVGYSVNGSSRWLRFAGVRFQPSELAKVVSIILISWWMARVQRQADTFRKGLLVPLSCIVVFAVLIISEPDFGTTMLVGVVGMTIMFVGGTRLGYLLVSGLGGLGGMVLLISQEEERKNRVIAFLDPEKYAGGEAFQLMQALYSFVSGGATGVGLGESLQKRHYLPEAHTDFIFAILGEELGFRATIAIVLLYFGFFVCGFLISLRTQDRFGKLLCFGLVTMITIQAALNIGVVTGSLPTKGITLPFMSFGGSSMLISLVMVGIMVNIAQQMPVESSEQDRRIIKDRVQQV